VSLILDGLVEKALPPAALAFQGRLKHELQSLQSRGLRLATCEKSMHESAAGFEEKQLQFEIARDIVIQEKLYVETCKSIKEWEDSLEINKQQLDCSKSHKDNVQRSTRHFYHRTGAWPWNVIVQDQHPTSWSRAILQGLAKLADLLPVVGDISTKLQEAIQNRIRRTSRRRGLSKVEKLVSADVYAVIKTIEQSIPGDKVENKGMSNLQNTLQFDMSNSDCAVSKKRKKGEQDKARPSKRQAKVKAATGGKAAESEAVESGAAATTCTVISEGGIVPESVGQGTSSMQGNAGADNVVPATPTSIDRRARVEEIPESDPEATGVNHQEPTSQQPLFQEPLHTPRNWTPTAVGLPTPAESGMRTTLQRPDTVPDRVTPPHDTEHAPQASPTPMPRAPRPQMSHEAHVASNTHATNAPPQLRRSPVASGPSDPVDRAKTAFNDSQTQLREAERQIRNITAAQTEMDSRILYCERLLQHPKNMIAEIGKSLLDVVEAMAVPHQMLLVQKEKLKAMRIEAVRFREERGSIAKTWAVIHARVRSQQH